MTINAQRVHPLPKDTTMGEILRKARGDLDTTIKLHDNNIYKSPVGDVHDDNGWKGPDTLYLDPPLSNINGVQEDTLIMVMYGHEVMRVAGGRVFINPYYFPRFPRWDWPNDSWYLIYDMARDKSTQIILNNKPKHKRK